MSTKTTCTEKLANGKLCGNGHLIVDGKCSVHWKPAHTPTPWLAVKAPASEHKEGIHWYIEEGSQHATVATIYMLCTKEWTDANAAFIVRAVNAHEELLEALYQALPYVEDQLQDQGYKPGAVERKIKFIKEAIAKAEGR